MKTVANSVVLNRGLMEQKRCISEDTGNDGYEKECRDPVAAEQQTT